MEPGSILPSQREVPTHRQPETSRRTEAELPVEIVEKHQETEGAQVSSALPPVAQALSGKALPSPVPPQDQSSASVASSTPLVAADEDLVEKEWVDKAKKIVAQTKDDPYQQEKEVSRLQADYLKKRYGKEIKVSDEQ